MHYERRVPEVGTYCLSPTENINYNWFTTRVNLKHCAFLNKS